MNPVNNTTPCLIISKESKKIKLKENDWLGLIPQCTEVQFSSFFSGGFITTIVKFIYSEKATRFCEIFPLLLTTVHTAGKISQNFVAFLEYWTMAVINPPEKKLANRTSVHCGISPSQSFSFNLIFLDSFEISKQGKDALFTGFTPGFSRNQLKPFSYSAHQRCRLGWAPWNPSCLEFKFDDTRLSYWHKNKIGRIEKKNLLLPDFANFLPGWPAQFWWDSQRGRELAKSGSVKKNFQFCQSYSDVNRKVCYHQIWIPNNLGFMVSDLIYIPIFWEFAPFLYFTEI